MVEGALESGASVFTNASAFNSMLDFVDLFFPFFILFCGCGSMV